METTVHNARTTIDPIEPPELLARNIRVGSRIWAASQAFFFLAFFFAFLYLRALNTAGLWRGWPHHHPSPSLAFGVAILICVLAGAAVVRLSVYLSAVSWRVGALAALVLVLAAVGLQSAQFSSLGFGPTDAAYASVFVGWTGLFTLTLLGTAYWLTTVVGDVSRAGETDLAVRAAAVDGVSFVLLVLAGVEIAAFILLYIVK
jgi:heme/copper-type cytochrome/quinol oxidase subunit 3